jgi:hypothetical protein
MSEEASQNVELTPDTPLQSGIRDLLVVQAVCAVCLGLFAMVGIFALLAIFIATLSFCAVRVQPRTRKLKRCIVDLMGGTILPAMCLVYDPGIFSNWHAAPDVVTAVTLLTIVFQMVLLPTWMIAGRGVGRWSSLFGGALAVGAIAAGGVGALLAPLSLIGTIFYGIGLLGFTPILTCVVFSRNAADAMRQARAADENENRWIFFQVGFLVAAAIPLLMHLCLGTWIATAAKSLPRPHELWKAGLPL